MMAQTEHAAEIVDQFTRQAAQLAQFQTAKNQDILNQIIRMAEPGPSDTMLDVACGPGLLALEPRRDGGKLLLSFPGAVMAVRVPHE
jgi:ubiquinone/menaquinone biosynthesis C-methylase UbiE